MFLSQRISYRNHITEVKPYLKWCPPPAAGCISTHFYSVVVQDRGGFYFIKNGTLHIKQQRAAPFASRSYVKKRRRLSFFKPSAFEMFLSGFEPLAFRLGVWLTTSYTVAWHNFWYRKSLEITGFFSLLPFKLWSLIQRHFGWFRTPQLANS